MRSGKPSYQPFQMHHLSHDFREPLNSVLGFTELLLDEVEGPLTETQREDIGAIQQSAKQLFNLVTTVVDLGKIDAGRLELNTGIIDLSHLIGGVVAQQQQSRSSSGAKIVITELESPALVLADYKRVAQIIQSVLEYLGHKVKQATIGLSLTKTAGQAAAKISLPALVIEAETLAHLFTPTVRVEPNGRTTLTEGKLTLPLSYKLAAAHQGNLSVESNSEDGTYFTLTLPLVERDEGIG